MAYCLEPGENPAAGLRRIAREQIGQAIKSAARPAKDRDEAIHDIRKCMKKVRAVLRMARGELGEKTYKSENACFRDAAKSLAELREAAVLAGTVEKLESQFAEQLAPGTFDSLLQHLRGKKDAVSERDLSQKNALDEVARVLREARKRVKDWPLKSKDFSLMAPGIRRVYKRGRQGLKDVQKSPTDESFHEWRKQVKYLWYHARILEGSWPPVMAALVSELDTLGDLLGEDHDLADLRRRVAQEPRLAGEPSEYEALLGLITRRQDELRNRALALGKRLYAETPKAFVARLAVYWSAAQASSSD